MKCSIFMELNSVTTKQLLSNIVNVSKTCVRVKKIFHSAAKNSILNRMLLFSLRPTIL